MRVEIDYTCAMLEPPAPGDYRAFNVSNLISPAVIKAFPDLARHCVFVTEQIPYPQISKDNSPTFRKVVSLVFSKSTVVGSHGEIEAQMKELLLKIKNETELVQKDNLARGVLIEPVLIWSMLRKSEDNQRHWWATETDKLKCEFGDSDPPEYWGDLSLYASDFIAGLAKYPWMPSDISKEEFPF